MRNVQGKGSPSAVSHLEKRELKELKRKKVKGMAWAGCFQCLVQAPVKPWGKVILEAFDELALKRRSSAG